MIKANFKLKDNKIVKVEINGHAGYDIEGKDIVCASISTLALSTVQNINTLCETEVINSEQAKGKMVIDVKENNKTVDILLDNMYNIMHKISKDYPKYIKITKKEE